MNKPVDLKLETIPLWINGNAVAPAAPRMGDVYNPATGQVVRRVPFCDAALVDSAVKAASAALAEWRDWPAIRRARVMQRFLRALEENQKDLARPRQRRARQDRRRRDGLDPARHGSRRIRLRESRTS
jgi:acyl-CoA reductase-like NAD-dependent aldehyde dehydrogenase